MPISTVGGPDSMPVLATGRRLAKVLALNKVARLKMFPIAIQVPWRAGAGCPYSADPADRASEALYGRPDQV